ncbi:50S ribosomal protein L11 [Candidatus Woesearchaeota archaeon]|nr:50S ribosomal protein L11 [Candidatus Woesearchaeota archaeon]
MPTQIVESLVEGGKATAAPPLGPALGPLGLNIGQVIAKINEKTRVFAGMKVPIKIKADTTAKTFDVEVGTPPTSQLIKKEAEIEKGSGSPKEDLIADILIEQVIKIAKMKESSLAGKTLKDRVKEVIGTCNSMGIMVEGKRAVESIVDVNAGKFDAEIKAEKTELTVEEKAKLEEEKKRLAEEIEKRKAELTKTAQDIIASMAGKERGAIKAKLREAGIPEVMIRELLPVEGAGAAGAEGKPGAPGAPGAAPAAGAAAPAGKAAAPAEKKKESKKK